MVYLLNGLIIALMAVIGFPIIIDKCKELVKSGEAFHLMDALLSICGIIVVCIAFIYLADTVLGFLK